RSGLVLDGPFVPMPPPFINPEDDERAEETLTDPELAEYTGMKRISDKRTKNQAKTDKTEHGVEKHGKAKVKSKQKTTKVKVKVKTEADTEEYLMGPPHQSNGPDKPISINEDLRPI
ncbi:hypothetical protein Tco_0595970, partial [Tanacetum coccineum]